MRKALRVAAWAAVACLVAIAPLGAPIVYVEAACSAEAAADEYVPIISDPAWRRAEARTFLTYPEWQMVYAYQEIADVLARGDEHEFGYFRALDAFWSSYCILNRQAGLRGGSDWETRSMLYTIGTSFNVEMALKAVYEETLGRAAASARGDEKTPQDEAAAAMAREYGEFLQQTPWYEFPFAKHVDLLWEAPIEGFLRGWERRLALGAEWSAKQAYAVAIREAVEATGKDELRIRSVVAGMSPEQLQKIEGVSVVGPAAGHVVVETNRYAEFTTILRHLAKAGGDVVEIAGNDNVMVSALREPKAAEWPSEFGKVLAEVDRQGSTRLRVLVLLKVDRLTTLLRKAPEMGAEVEHVYDY